jgi:predicted phage-related endonuclease
MRHVKLEIGSGEWLRAFTASKAPAMMGADPRMSRRALMRAMATGITPEVSDWVQAHLFDKGHAYEAAARPLVEGIIGDDLYPVTGAETVEGLELFASFDGLTLDGGLVWEHKTLNDAIRSMLAGGDVEPVYYWQLEQQLLVSGADRALFSASLGTADTLHDIEYVSRPERRAALIAGWRQFAVDLAAWQPEPAAEPAPTGATVDAMPVPFVQIEGRIVATNMAQFRASADAFLGRLPKSADLQSDQDFADADKAAKACKEAEERLATVKATAQAQAADIDAVFREIDAVGARVRDARLALEKAVKARKETIRVEIVAQGQAALAAHLAGLRARCGGRVDVASDFAGAIKGRRTIAGLRDAVDAELARAKIAANEIADESTRTAGPWATTPICSPTSRLSRRNRRKISRP